MTVLFTVCGIVVVGLFVVACVSAFVLSGRLDGEAPEVTPIHQVTNDQGELRYHTDKTAE